MATTAAIRAKFEELKARGIDLGGEQGGETPALGTGAQDAKGEGEDGQPDPHYRQGESDQKQRDQDDEPEQPEREARQQEEHRRPRPNHAPTAPPAPPDGSSASRLRLFGVAHETLLRTVYPLTGPQNWNPIRL